MDFFYFYFFNVNGVRILKINKYFFKILIIGISLFPPPSVNFELPRIDCIQTYTKRVHCVFNIFSHRPKTHTNKPPKLHLHWSCDRYTGLPHSFLYPANADGPRAPSAVAAVVVDRFSPPTRRRTLRSRSYTPSVFYLYCLRRRVARTCTHVHNDARTYMHAPVYNPPEPALVVPQ